jgi:hypothetical protein
MPVTFPTQSRQYRLILWRAKLNKITDPPSAPAPLFPVAHAGATPEPMIELHSIVILQSDTEVVHPSLKIGTGFPVPVIHRDAPTTPGKATQFGFKPHEGFLGDSKPFTGEGESEERTLLSFHHPAFVPVDLHLAIATGSNLHYSQMIFTREAAGFRLAHMRIGKDAKLSISRQQAKSRCV